MKGGHSIFLTGRQISALEIAAAKSASSRVAFEQGGKRIVLNLEHLNRRRPRPTRARARPRARHLPP